MFTTFPNSDLSFKEIDLIVLSRMLGHMGTPFAVYLGADTPRPFHFSATVPLFYRHSELYAWARRGGVLFNFSKENLLDGLWSQLGLCIIQGTHHSEIVEDACICNAVDNPDGTIRWVFPAFLKAPHFLHLYNASGWKAQAFKKAIRATYQLGFGKRFGDQQFIIGYWSDTSLCKEIERQRNVEWAAFLGTKGETRKAVVYLPDGVGAFYKKPLAPKAIPAMENERNTLTQVDFSNIPYLQVPMLEAYSSGIAVSDIKPDYALPLRGDSDLLMKLWADFAQLEHRQARMGETSFFRETESYLTQLQTMKIGATCHLDPKKTKQLIQGLTLLFEAQNPDWEIPFSFSHGDFTPWNMYFNGSHIYLYDFEFAQNRPLFYDLFHFFFQSGILIHRHAFSKIFHQMETAFESPHLQPTDPYRKQRKVFYHWYLLHQVSYYLLRFLQQKPLHRQAHWLVDIWHEAVMKDIREPSAVVV